MTQKFYPLSTYKNKDILEYISRQNLKSPESFDGQLQSAGQDVTDYGYLKYLEKHYPQDLERIYAQFPLARVVIPQHEAETSGEQENR